MLFNSFRLRSSRLDFETHLKYVSLVDDLSSNIKVSSTLTPKLKKTEVCKLKDKIQLIKLTKSSIDQEYKIVCFDKEYSSVSVLWLPIKCYYLLYHLLCVVDCLLTGNKSSLNAGHHSCVNVFNKMLKNSEMQFSEPLLNNVFDESILNFKTQSGEHLRHDAKDDRVYKLIMKKVAKGKIDNYKIVNGLSGRRIKDKARISNFNKNMQVSIFDFFHLMRLRMNYRNLNFVDKIPASDTEVYFKKYYSSANNFYNCFISFINELNKKCS